MNSPFTDIVIHTVIGVAFVTPTQSVDEGAGTTDVCFMANASSSQPYDVVLSHEPTGANPACMLINLHLIKCFTWNNVHCSWR